MEVEEVKVEAEAEAALLYKEVEGGAEILLSKK